MSIADDIQYIKKQSEEYSMLTTREVTDLVTILHESDPRDVKNLRSLFEQDPRWIERFYENFKAKKEAVLNRDRSAWNKVIEDQTREFEDFSFGI